MEINNTHSLYQTIFVDGWLHSWQNQCPLWLTHNLTYFSKPDHTSLVDWLVQPSFITIKEASDLPFSIIRWCLKSPHRILYYPYHTCSANLQILVLSSLICFLSSTTWTLRSLNISPKYFKSQSHGIRYTSLILIWTVLEQCCLTISLSYCATAYHYPRYWPRFSWMSLKNWYLKGVSKNLNFG